MGATTIEALQIQIEGSASNANQAIDKLAESLGKLKTATAGGAGLASVAKALEKLNGINPNTSALTQTVNALKGLTSIQGVNISASIGHQLKAIAEAMNAVNPGAMDNMKKIGEVLQPLSNLAKPSGLTSMLNSLKKLPEITAGLDDKTLTDFEHSIERVTNALGPLNERLQTVQTNARGMTQEMARLNQQQSGTNGFAARGAGTVTDLWSGFQMAATAIRGVSRSIAEAINSTNEYIENMNLFNVSMGDFATSAERYAQKVGSVMGINPGEWMRNQGVFQTLATGFGVAADRATIMSQNLTQLGYDLSSFFNIPIAESMQKLQSGLSGELEPLRRLGYDLSQARLEAEAAALGIKKKFTDMTQAEKSQLRYMAIMSQVQTAQGDMARTLDQPANQMRVLRAACEQAAIAIGSIFIPALNAILPVAIAVVNAIREVANAIAGLFGGSINFGSMGSSAASGLNQAASAAENLDKALSGGGGGGSKKDTSDKIKEMLADFDELNVIASEAEDAAGGGGGGGGGSKNVADLLDPSAWQFDLAQYDFLGELVKSKASQIYDTIRPVVDYIKDHLVGIKDLIVSIATAFGMWKAYKWFEGFAALETAAGWMKTMWAMAFLMSDMVLTFHLTTMFDTDWMETGNVESIIADGILSAAGAAFAGLTVSKVASAGWAFEATGATLLVSTAASLKVLYDQSKSDGLKTTERKMRAAVEYALSILKGAVGSAFVAAGLAELGAFGAGVGAATAGAIGFVAGGVITAAIGFALVSAGIVANEIYEANAAKVNWGDEILSTKEEMRTMAESLFTIPVQPKISLVTATINNVTETKTKLEEDIRKIESELRIVNIGISTESNLQALQLGVDSLIEDLQTNLDASKKTVAVAFELVPPTNEDGSSAASEMLTNLATNNLLISNAAEYVGKAISGYITKGLNDGLTEQEQEWLSMLTNTLIDVAEATGKGKASGVFQAGLKTSLANLDRTSMMGVLGEVQTLLGDYTGAITQVQDEALQSLYGNATALDVYAARLRQMLEAGYEGVTEAMVKTYEDAADKAWKEIALYESRMEGDRQAAIEAATGQIGTMFAEALRDGVLNTDEMWDIGKMLGDYQLFYMSETGEHTDLLAQRIQAVIETAINSLNPDDQKAVKDIQDAFGITAMQLMPESKVTELYNGLVEMFNKETVDEAFKNLGLNIPGEVANGIAENTSSATTAMQTLSSSLSEIFSAANGSAVANGWLGGFFSTLNNGLASINVSGAAFGNKRAGGMANILKGMNIGKFASGGFPTDGQLFIARESGAEMVGSIGNRTAVANNDQIVDGVASGVAAGQGEQNSLLREQNALLQALLRKESKVTITPSVSLGRVAARSAQMYEKAFGV